MFQETRDLIDFINTYDSWNLNLTAQNNYMRNRKKRRVGSVLDSLTFMGLLLGSDTVDS